MSKAIAKMLLIGGALVAGMAIGQAEIAEENAGKSGGPNGIPLQPISDNQVGLTHPAQAADPLALGFREPPKESGPETWFHLIGGNVAKVGLTADLEAIGGAGISGIQLFHGQFGGPWPGVEPQVSCLSPQWDGMISHVANECRRLGLSFTMQNCPGWAMSGGPWITPDKAMRHLTWSRVEVAGGKQVSLMLAKPQPSSESWRDYRDVAVIAFPTPAGADGKNLLPTSVRSNREKLPWGDLLAGKKGANVRIESGNERVWVELGFAAPVTLRSLELPPVGRMMAGAFFGRYFDPGAAIRVQALVRNDWRDVARWEIPRSSWQDDRPLTLALPASTSTTFRLVFELKSPMDLSNLGLSSEARLDNWEGKAGFVLRSLEPTPPPTQDPKAWVMSGRILDLSDTMGGNGNLNWDAPAGNWTILRFGHVNTGARNGPAPAEATGFECDKLSAAGADQHFAGYIGRISAPGGPADKGRLQGMLTDSWECHTQTWTPAMEREFASRRRYALRKWLPALAGYVIDDPGRSERFLRDWRATISDLVVSNYYGRLAALGRERGLKLSFETALGDISPGDILQYFGQADIPMCEFWQPNDPDWGGLETKPIIPCTSAAHIYGKPRIAAEAFTSGELRWNEHPFMLKHFADRHFTYGLNHLIFHTYTHNPRPDVVPGSSFGAGIGTPFLRNQTWWRHMPAFTKYLARCQFMLEQGRPVADVLWYLGDELDHKPRQETPFPAGFRFDYLNQDVLLNRLCVVDGNLTTPEGVAWKVLWLRNYPRLTPETLAGIRGLLRDGATVVGEPPKQNAGLSGGPEADDRFTALVRDLWGDNPAANGERRIGAGRLLWGGDFGSILARLKLEPDVTGASSATWCHRRTDDAEIYFVAAARDQSLRANLSFRAQGRPEFWDPLTGTSRPAAIFHRQDAHTLIPLDLPAAGSVFVVFRKGEATPVVTRIERDGMVLVDARDTTRVDKGTPEPVQGLKYGEIVQPWVGHPLAECAITDEGAKLLAWEPGRYRVLRGDQTVTEVTIEGPRDVPLAGPWSLSFPPGWDAPERLELPALKLWSELEDQAARSFSGSATYSYELKLDTLRPDERALLDLGQVANIAEVSVNGKPAATLWTAPFRGEITSFLKPGINRIMVTVTSTWRNRLAYDAGLPEAQHKTWTISGPPADATREEAGLKGPVGLRVGRVIGFAQPARSN